MSITLNMFDRVYLKNYEKTFRNKEPSELIEMFKSLSTEALELPHWNKDKFETILQKMGGIAHYLGLKAIIDKEDTAVLLTVPIRIDGRPRWSLSSNVIGELESLKQETMKFYSMNERGFQDTYLYIIDTSYDSDIAKILKEASESNGFVIRPTSRQWFKD